MTTLSLRAPRRRLRWLVPLGLAGLSIPVLTVVLVAAVVSGMLGSCMSVGQTGEIAAGAEIPAELRPLVEQAATSSQLHPALLAGLARAESGWNPNAVSPVGAAGLTQLMPATARGLSVTDPFDPAQNLGGGARYLRQQLDRFGSVDLALAAYNAGPGNVSRYGGIPPFAETQAYVPKVKGYAAEYGWAETGAPLLTVPDPAPAPRSAPGAWGGYSNGRIPASALAPVPGHPGTILRPDAAAGMGAMVQAAAADGVTLNPGGGYRSYQGQVETRASWCARGDCRMAATPGNSNHGWALAIDMQDLPFTSSGYIWMFEHAQAYGWAHPEWAQRHGSKEESWHWEWIGGYNELSMLGGQGVGVQGC